MPHSHPLTDEMCKEIKLHIFNRAYAKGRNDQLEQVIEQWEELMDSDKTDVQMIRELDKRLKAMRPQQQEGDGSTN